MYEPPLGWRIAGQAGEPLLFDYLTVPGFQPSLPAKYRSGENCSASRAVS